jgi:23S rRNA (guanosine2251-2'-O)-methyltransferase
MANRNNVLYALHDIEEFLKSLSGKGAGGARLSYSGDGNRREKDIIEKARRRGVRCVSLDANSFSSLAERELGSPVPKALRHLLLEVPETYLEQRAGDSDLMARLAEDRDRYLVLILDGITDPHNLGAILRSANLFEVDAVVLPKKRSAQINDTVRRVSAGASHHTPVFYVTNLVRIIEELKTRGFWIYCADLGGERPDTQDLSGKTALVLGSEGSGPGREVARHADAVVSIPTGGEIDSFNVSVAAGILLYEIRRQGAFAFRAAT